MSKRLSRRELLGTMGVAGAALVVGCNTATGSRSDGGVDGASGGPDAAASPADLATSMDAGSLDCVVTPALTEGPFFVDEGLERSDLTAGTSEPFVTGGLPF